MTQPQEQIDIHDMVAVYRQKVSDLEHGLVIMECRLKNRDETIESLTRQLDALKNQ